MRPGSGATSGGGAAGDAEVRAMFKRLRAGPGNSVCADCPARNPQWASCTHGAYICRECAGVHRGLGVEISFVQSVRRSPTLDRTLKMLSDGVLCERH